MSWSRQPMTPTPELFCLKSSFCSHRSPAQPDLFRWDGTDQQHISCRVFVTRYSSSLPSKASSTRRCEPQSSSCPPPLSPACQHQVPRHVRPVGDRTAPALRPPDSREASTTLPASLPSLGFCFSCGLIAGVCVYAV